MKLGGTYYVQSCRAAYTFINSVYESIYAMWDLIQVAQLHEVRVPKVRKLTGKFFRAIRPDKGLPYPDPLIKRISGAVGLFLRKQQQLL